MKRLHKYLHASSVVPALLILTGLGLMFAAYSDNSVTQAVDAPGVNQSSDESMQDETDKPEGVVGAAYVTAVVQPGDSQTLIARRILKEYLSTDRQKLSPAKLIYVETRMVDQVKRIDHIEPGDSITFNLKQTEEFIKDSKELSAAALQVWSGYAQTVIF